MRSHNSGGTLLNFVHVLGWFHAAKRLWNEVSPHQKIGRKRNVAIITQTFNLRSDFIQVYARDTHVSNSKVEDV